MTTNAVFPAILGFFKRVLYSWYRQRVSGNSRDVLLVSPPPPPQGPFSKPLSVCHFLLFFLLSSISTLFFFINPFWDIILVSFLWFYLCCPFPFFVSASFLPTSFLPSPSPIHLAFILGRFALLFFLFARYCFQAWRFLLSFSCWFLFGFLLIVVVTFFHHWELYSLFLFLLFLVVQMWRRLFWFQPKALFSKPLSVCHSLLFLFLFLSSISTFQGFFSWAQFLS